MILLVVSTSLTEYTSVAAFTRCLWSVECPWSVPYTNGTPLLIGLRNGSAFHSELLMNLANIRVHHSTTSLLMVSSGILHLVLLGDG